MGILGARLLACLALLSPAAAPGPRDARDEAAALDALLLRHASGGWSGAALVVKGGAVLLARGYGFADPRSMILNDEHTLFEIASLTKSFTAVALQRLAQQGRLALDDSIAVHLPGVPEHSRGITLRHLLAHTSGIPRTNTRGGGDDLARAVLDYLGDGPRTKPGAQHEYWNGGYALLAGVIERVSGLSYQQVLEQELFLPAGMARTGFTGDTDLDARQAAFGRAASGPSRGALEHPYRDYGYQYRGMGGIVTCVRDLAAWDRALSGDLLLDEAHRRELFTPLAGGYALGWRIGRALDGSPRQSHGGAVRGFVCEFRRLPALDGCVAVLCNSDDQRPDEIADNLEALLLDRAPAHAAPKTEGLTLEEAQVYAGAFACAEGRVVTIPAHGLLLAGLEGDALLARLGLDGKLDWKADRTLLARRAAEILEGLATGNTGPLREHMAKRIPSTWPDAMRTSVWPAHLAEHGAYRGVRPLGTRARAQRLEVLLAVEHERSPARVLVAFGPAGLELLDLHGPPYLVTAPLLPLRANAFELDLGGAHERLDFERKGGVPTGLRLAGAKLTRQ